MKKLTALFLVFAVFCFMSDPTYAKSWWEKIIERMMNEGIDRTDDFWDDAHAFRMGYDAYVLYPKSFSGSYDIVDLDLYPKAEVPKVSADTASGKYGPVSFSGDASRIISAGSSKRKALVVEKANDYKLQAQARIAVYAERAQKIRESMSSLKTDIDGISGKSLEVTAGVHSEKAEAMFDNIALKVYMNELLALKTALTGEIALIGTVKYANMVADSLNGYIKIYDMVR